MKGQTGLALGACTRFVWKRMTARRDRERERSPCWVGCEHINGVEGFWSYAKNWWYSYRGVAKDFSLLRLVEIWYRFNCQDEDIYSLIIRMLKTTSADDIRQR